MVMHFTGQAKSKPMTNDKDLSTNRKTQTASSKSKPFTTKTPKLESTKKHYLSPVPQFAGLESQSDAEKT